MSEQGGGRGGGREEASGHPTRPRAPPTPPSGAAGPRVVASEDEQLAPRFDGHAAGEATKRINERSQ